MSDDYAHHISAAEKALKTAYAALLAVPAGPSTYRAVQMRREAVEALCAAISECRDAKALVERDWLEDK